MFGLSNATFGLSNASSNPLPNHLFVSNEMSTYIKGTTNKSFKQIWTGLSKGTIAAINAKYGNTVKAVGDDGALISNRRL